MTSNRRPSATHGPGSRGPGRRRRSSDASAERTSRSNTAAQSRSSAKDAHPENHSAQEVHTQATPKQDAYIKGARKNDAYIDSPQKESASQADRATAGRNASRTATRSAEGGATRGRQQTKATRVLGPKSRWAEFLPVAGWTSAFLAIIVVLIAIATVLLSGAGYNTIPATIGTVWMAVHLAPFTFNDTVLGMLPGLPAFGVITLVAVMVRRAVKKPVSIKDVAALAAGIVAVPLLVTCVAWLMLWDASKVFALSPPPLWRALLTVSLIHGLGFCFGLGQTLWRGITRHYGLPDELVDASRLAGRWLATLAGAGLVALLLMLAVRFGTLQQAYEIAPGAGAKIALTLLNVLYLPNAVVGAAAVLLGGDASVGVASASLFALTPGTLPPMPLLAAMPTGELIPWFAALLVVPAALVVWVTIRHFREGSDAPLVEVGGAAVLSALGAAVAAVVLGGELGLYGWSGATWWLVGGLAALWLAVVGTCVVMVAIWRGFFTLVDDGGADGGASAGGSGAAAGGAGANGVNTAGAASADAASASTASADAASASTDAANSKDADSEDANPEDADSEDDIINDGEVIDDEYEDDAVKDEVSADEVADDAAVADVIEASGASDAETNEVGEETADEANSDADDKT